jgi:hypothetical protein
VRGTGKPRHVGPDFRQNDLGHAPIHPGNLVQPLNHRGERAHARGDLPTHLLNHRIEVIDVRQLLGDQELVMGAKASRQCPLQLGDLLPQLAVRQLRQRRRIGRPRHQALEHRASRDPQNVGGHGRQLDVGSFQHLLQPIDFRRPLAHQRRPIAGHFPQLPLLLGGHEAGPQQPVAQQVGDPLGILDVALAAGHRLDVLRVDQQQGEVPFQHVVDRLPVGSAAREVRVPPPFSDGLPPNRTSAFRQIRLSGVDPCSRR